MERRIRNRKEVEFSDIGVAEPFFGDSLLHGFHEFPFCALKRLPHAVIVSRTEQCQTRMRAIQIEAIAQTMPPRMSATWCCLTKTVEMAMRKPAMAKYQKYAGYASDK